MLKSVVSKVPSYRRHKPTGQAVVTLSGKDHYLGKWNTAASRAEYDRLIGEWLAAGRCWPTVAQADLTVAEVALRYWRFAESYYVKNGVPSPFLTTIRLALRHLRKVYGPTLVRDFGPLALRAMQERFVRGGHSRSYVNKLCAVLCRMFKWGVSLELVPVTVHQALTAVPGLRKGRTAAREPVPVRPVNDEIVNATLSYLPTIAADMVRLQRLTGCRPGEVCLLRPCDVDTSEAVWSDRPESHKTEHHGRDRVIFIGPKGQDVLRPYLLRDKAAYCFVPAESERKRNAVKRENRQTPMTPSQARRRRKRHPRRSPGDRYCTASYRRAITRAASKANREREKQAAAAGVDPILLPNWHPNQLRHSAATEIRRQFGLEAAQVALGHSQADVTQIYAERDMTLAAEVMRKIG